MDKAMQALLAPKQDALARIELEHPSQKILGMDASKGVISNAIQNYVHAATSDNTRRAYRSDIRHFLTTGGILPASISTILDYLQKQAPLLNPRTLKRRLVAVKQWHTSQGFVDPTTHPLVRKTLSGILHVHGVPVQKAPALTIEQLQLIAQYFKSQSTGLLTASRNNALLQIGFFGAFRRSELAAMTWAQVRFVSEGVEILIPRSKTDQEGEGSVCAIPHGKALLCPVKALQQWREVSGALQGPVFRSIAKTERLMTRPLSAHAINHILKTVAMECGLPEAQHYSAHSLRRGFATTASRKGASFGAILRHGRWRHEATVHGYIEEGQRFESNAAGWILNKLL